MSAALLPSASIRPASMRSSSRTQETVCLTRSLGSGLHAIPRLLIRKTEVDGIGPLAGNRLNVSEINYDEGTLHVVSPSGDFEMSYTEGTIDVISTST
jgi:hypothetical protein